MKKTARAFGGMAALAVILSGAVVLIVLTPRPRTTEALVHSAREEASYEPIERQLSSRNYRDRLQAVHALLDLQTEAAYQLLEAACKDRTPIVRVVIARRMTNLPERAGLRLARHLLDDPHPAIVRDAVLGIEHLIGERYSFEEASEREKTRIIAQCKSDVDFRLLQRSQTDSVESGAVMFKH